MHNNYLTLPVLFTMLAGHSAFAYGAGHAWVVLIVIMILGAVARLFFNLRHQGRNVWLIPVGAALVLIGLVVALRPDDRPEASGGAAAAFADVAKVVAQRCAPCHAQSPTQPGFSSPPGGVVLETPQQIAARAEAIRSQVESKGMPIGNLTEMADEERELVIAWVDQGASTER